MANEITSDGSLAVLTMLTDHGNSIRELARSMDTGFADIRARLENKADKGDIVELRSRITQLEHHQDAAVKVQNDRIDKIQAELHRDEGRTQVLSDHETRRMSRRQVFWSSFGVLLLVAATILSALISSSII